MPDYVVEHLNYSCLSGFLYNAQVRAKVTLKSSNYSMPLKLDPKFLSHPYDCHVVIETLRGHLKMADHPAFAKDTVAPIAVPQVELG